MARNQRRGATKVDSRRPVEQLQEQYLTHPNILGEEGTHPNLDAWYQEVRYALDPNAPQSLEKASELRYKDVLVVQLL